jgi:hypothetical protein
MIVLRVFPLEELKGRELKLPIRSVWGGDSAGEKKRIV